MAPLRQRGPSIAWAIAASVIWPCVTPMHDLAAANVDGALTSSPGGVDHLKRQLSLGVGIREGTPWLRRHCENASKTCFEGP